MVAVNEKGEAQMISMISHTVIHTYKFSSAALCVKFSPDGKYFAAAKENMGSLKIMFALNSIQVDFHSFSPHSFYLQVSRRDYRRIQQFRVASLLLRSA